MHQCFKLSLVCIDLLVEADYLSDLPDLIINIGYACIGLSGLLYCKFEFFSVLVWFRRYVLNDLLFFRLFLFFDCNDIR